MSEVAQDSSSTHLQEYLGNRCINIAAAFIVLEVLVAMMRFYAKSLTEAPLSLDDYLLIPALISNLALCALGIVGKIFGSSQIPKEVTLMKVLAVRVAGVGYHQAAVMIKSPEAILRWPKVFTRALPAMSIDSNDSYSAWLDSSIFMPLQRLLARCQFYSSSSASSPTDLSE